MTDAKLRRELQRWYRVTALWLVGVGIVAAYGLMKG